ncbi:MAG: hypothetical protein HUN05_19255 [Desulfobacter sp.]|nr:MAG: hypothetical protein HUN05_19255 [Desulfobacter sp.]
MTEHQGAGNTEEEALSDCLKKIKGLNLEDLFPAAVPPATADSQDEPE